MRLVDTADAEVKISDGISEKTLKNVKVYSVEEADLSTEGGIKKSYIADIDTSQIINESRASGSTSNTQDSGRLQLRSSIWYKKVVGTGPASTFVGVKPYKVGGKVTKLPGLIRMTKIYGKLRMTGIAFIYPNLSNTTGTYSQNLSQTYKVTSSAQTKSVSPVSNRYYLAGTGGTFVKYTYSVKYRSTAGTKVYTASVTVFVNEN